MLNSKAQLTVDIIAKVAERKITIANAAKLLSKSRRTIERYLQCYREKGLQFVVHAVLRVNRRIKRRIRKTTSSGAYP